MPLKKENNKRKEKIKLKSSKEYFLP